MESDIEQIKQNNFFRHCLKELVHRLLHQYRSQSYNANDVLKNYFQKYFINSPAERQQTQASERDMSRMTQIKQISLQEVTAVKDIWNEISLFVWQLACTPKQIVFMLHNQEIHADESQYIDMHVFTTRIYKQFFVELSGRTPYSKIFQEIASEQVYFFIEQACCQICKLYQLGQEIIINLVNVVSQKLKKSNIVNSYLLYRLFKDISRICQNKIAFELSEGIFKNIETQVVELFVNYILEKYELLKLQMNEEGSPGRKKTPLTERIMNSNNVKWRQAIRQDGQIGILIQLQQQQGQQNYLLQFSEESEQIKVMNCKSIRKKWMVYKKAQQNYDIVKLVKNKKAFIERMRDSPPNIASMTVIDNLNILGGTMGRCLAQIDKYKNVGHFMADLSRRTLIGGSMSYMINAVPLLGYLFISGGFTYSFYYIFSNKYANKVKKMRDLGNMTIGTASSLGSGLLGAMVGQSLIPVPVLGAFIGGFVGGFLGEFGGRKLCDLLESSRSKQIQKQLQNTIQPKGYWDVNKRTLNILGINKQKFYETIPACVQKNMNCDRLWLTLIFYTLLTFYESKKRVKYIEKKLEQMENKENKIEEYEIIEENQKNQNTEDYKPSIDYVCVSQYIEESSIVFVQCFEEVQFLIQKMFARLK